MSKPKQLIFPFGINKKSSIKKFFVPQGCDNLIAAIKDNMAGDIFLSGKRGVGKSYLLQAACNDLSSPSFNTTYIPLSEAVKLRPELLGGLESLDLICIDDLHTVAANKEWEIACFNLINHCNETGCRLIFSCLENEENFFPDLLSRIKKMTNYVLSPVQDKELDAAIKAITCDLRIPIEEKEINYLLKTYTRDLAVLIELIKKIDNYSMGSKRKITIPLIKELL